MLTNKPLFMLFFLDLGFSYLKLRNRVRCYEKEWRRRKRNRSCFFDPECIEISTRNVFDETGETNKERSSENSQGVEVRAIFVVGFFWFY